MLLKHKLLLGLAFAGGLLANGRVNADPFLPVPPASFLNYHVSTARGLSEEVATDVVVRARLARHFGMSQSDMVSYVQANLVEGQLSAAQAGRYRVACITPSGREYSVMERLPAGTPVFLLARTGKPILRLACGNPLVSALPPVPAKPKMKPAAMVVSRTAHPVPVLATPQVAPSVTVQPAVMSTPVASVPTTVKVAGVTQSISHGGSSFVPVAVGGAAIGLLSHSHPNDTPPSPPTTVPEPNGLLLVSLFGAGLIAVQVRERRRRR